VANQKGGVGKTTVALGLAAAIEDSSGSVIVFDADPQQSAMEIAAAGSLPFEVRPALSAAELASIRQVRGLDTVIIDLPGNLTDTPVLGEVLAASDFAVIPVVPERAAILPTQRTAQIIADQNLPFKILCNLVDPLRGPAPVEQLRELLDAQDLPYFRSFIRRYVAHPQSQLDGLTARGAPRLMTSAASRSSCLSSSAAWRKGRQCEPQARVASRVAAGACPYAPGARAPASLAACGDTDSGTTESGGTEYGSTDSGGS
jgi:chromosome partitioning protein